MDERHQHTSEFGHGDDNRQFKRRGLIAGAAGIVAALLAKMTATPVEATHGGGADPTALHVDQANNATGSTQLYRNAGAGGSPTLYVANNVAGPGIRGDSATQFGVQGFTNSAAGYGVYGSSNLGTGVTGQSGSAGAGVYGLSPNAGVFGTGTGRGVWGTTVVPTGVGVYADGAGIGVYSSTANTTAVAGVASAGGLGIYGASSSFAGYFDAVGGVGGSVYIVGNLTVLGTKSAAVRLPDGSLRLLYCEESPESYFTDYGEEQLRGGRADVRFDQDFAAAVHTDNYQVFLTEYGDFNGLYVSSRTPLGFEVRAKDSPTAGGRFGYRVVARRKDVVAPRMERVSAPRAPGRPAPATAPTPPPPLENPSRPAQ